MLRYTDITKAILDYSPNNGLNGAPKAPTCVLLHKRFRVSLREILDTIKEAVKEGVIEEDDGMLWVVPAAYHYQT